MSLERIDSGAIAELSPELMEKVEEAIHHQLGFSAETASL
mgnify:CR=1 FL=1